MDLLRTLCCIIACAGVVSVSQAAAPEQITVKNDTMSRTVSWDGDLLRTTKVETRGKEINSGPGVEFMLELQYDGEWLWLTPKDFKVVGKSSGTVNGLDEATLNLQCQNHALPIFVHLTYRARVGSPYIQKSLSIDPVKLPDELVLRSIRLEDCQLQPQYSPVMPVDRYAGNSDDYPKADLSDTKTRFRYDTAANYTAYDEKGSEGLFCFLGSLFGIEGCTTNGRLIMAEEMYVPLAQGYDTGWATIGAVPGPPELLFKRFREFVWDNYCVMRGKKNMVIYETWMNEKQNVSEEKCLAEMKAMQEEGYFTAFHLDYGWENHYPLTEDKEKFAQGLPRLAQQAKDMGLGMVYWINPGGSKGQTTDKPNWGGQWDGLMKEHPEWFATYDAMDNPNPEGNDLLCFTTPYADFVEKKLLRLVNECGAVMLYDDGNEWNEFKCPESGPYHMEKAQLEYAVPKRLSEMYDKLHKANPKLVICLSPQVGNVPGFVHRLNTIDQFEFWDGTADGCLGDRQQRYNQMFIYPPYTMQSGCYTTDMNTPFPQLKYVILSTLPGYPQNQGTQQIAQPNPELSTYLKKVFAFREKFEPYFEVYQHVLDFPDGKSVDGEGHIIDNKGFILLFNPAEQAQKITLPLNEPGLELKGNLKLTDWTGLESGEDMGTAKVGESVEVEIGPVSAKIIGVNID